MSKSEKNNKNKKALRIKIISMGNAEVGKSCIIKRYCEKRFVHKYLATIGIDYGVTKYAPTDQITLDPAYNEFGYIYITSTRLQPADSFVVHACERDIKVNIFDMAGHPIFYEVRNEFYKDTQGAMIVYDASDRASFDVMDSWMAEMKNDIGNSKDMENIVFVVCANKCDKKPRQVDEVDGKLWADSHGFPYFETSAATGDGVIEMFNCLFERVVGAIENGGKLQPSTMQLGYTKEQVDAIQRLKNARSDWERLGLYPGASKDDVNKAYRKLAVLLHPDKSVAPGSEEAFKILVATRTTLLKNAR